MKTQFKLNDEVTFGDSMGRVVAIHKKEKLIEVEFHDNKVWICLFDFDGHVHPQGRFTDVPDLKIKQRPGGWRDEQGLR